MKANVAHHTASRKARRRHYHYPAVIQGADGTLHFIYSYFVKAGKSMKHVATNEAWVRQGDAGTAVRRGTLSFRRARPLLASLPLGEHSFFLFARRANGRLCFLGPQFARPPTAPHAASLIEGRRPRAAGWPRRNAPACFRAFREMLLAIVSAGNRLGIGRNFHGPGRLWLWQFRPPAITPATTLVGGLWGWGPCHGCSAYPAYSCSQTSGYPLSPLLVPARVEVLWLPELRGGLYAIPS